jgi:hypothetical protein
VRRLLVVGKELPNFPSTTWAEWASVNPLDYQGLVLDCRDLGQLPPHATIGSYLQTYINIGHPVYVILPGAKVVEGLKGALTFVPGIHLYLHLGAGQTLELKSPDPLFESYIKILERHEIYLKFNYATNQQPGWIPGIVDNVARPICIKILSVYLLHPPPPRNELKAFKSIIEHFKPDVLTTSSVPKPGWVEEEAAKLPGVAEAESVRKSMQAEIELKNEKLQAQEDQIRSLTGWADLLWLDGIPLQTKVGEALNLLGIPAKADDPTGHTGDLTADEPETYFVFEVTGSTGSIGIEKGRQLLQWVSEAPDPNATKGVLIANPFRNHEPSRRPPTSDHRLFVTELEKFAERFHLALLDVCELYRVVSLKLAGHDIDKPTVLNTLTKDGLVRFPIS